MTTIACTLSSRDLSRQAERWRALRASAQIDRADVADGIAIGFRADPGVEAELRALVAAENECCAWARWEVRRRGTDVELVATSTGDGVAALHQMLR
jgi:hypothetical protein